MRARVTFEVEIPEGISETDAREWLRFELHDKNEIDNRNPALKWAVEPVDGIIIVFDYGS